MKLTANKAKRKASKYNRKTYRNDVLREYKAITKNILFQSKRGYSSTCIRCGIWDFEAYHAIRLFCYKHRDFVVAWKYDGEPADRRVDLAKHDKFNITIKW